MALCYGGHAFARIKPDRIGRKQNLAIAAQVRKLSQVINEQVAARSIGGQDKKWAILSVRPEPPAICEFQAVPPAANMKPRGSRRRRMALLFAVIDLIGMIGRHRATQSANG